MTREYTMKQVALMLGVHRDTIHYWEENGLIDVARRNKENNYRTYNIDDVWAIAKRRGISVVDVEAVDREKEKRRQMRKNKLL